MEGGKEGMPKIAELKLEEVKENETEVKPEEHLAVPPPAAKEKLQFKDMPLDMKRLVFSYVRKFLHVLFLSICWLMFPCLSIVSFRRPLRSSTPLPANHCALMVPLSHPLSVLKSSNHLQGLSSPSYLFSHTYQLETYYQDQYSCKGYQMLETDAMANLTEHRSLFHQT